jgi:hypothetical protein
MNVIQILIFGLMLVACLGLILVIRLKPRFLQRFFGRRQPQQRIGAQPTAASRPKAAEVPHKTSQKPVDNPKPVVNQKPVVTSKPVDTPKPVDTRKPVDTPKPVDIQQTLEEVKAARQRYERVGELRYLDIRVAEAFLLYGSIEWGRNYSQATGIPRIEYDHHRQGDNLFREAIPRYSTDHSDFVKIESSPIGSELRELFLTILAEEELDNSAMTLEQQCLLWLKVRDQDNKRRTKEGPSG